MNDKIRQEAMHLHNWCEGQYDCAHCDFGRDNRTCKISGIPAQWFDDEDHSADDGKKYGTPTDTPTDTVAPTDAPTASGKTRQERFLELFPRADAHTGVLEVCPGDIDMRFTCHEPKDCADCKKEYWLAAEKEGKS